MYMDYKLIGTRIKEKRKACNLTQEQLSEKLSVTVGYVSQLERGYTKINLETLAKICHFLHADISYILDGTIHQESSYKNTEIHMLLSQMSPTDKSLVFDIIKAIIKNKE